MICIIEYFSKIYRSLSKIKSLQVLLILKILKNIKLLDLDLKPEVLVEPKHI